MPLAHADYIMFCFVTPDPHNTPRPLVEFMLQLASDAHPAYTGDPTSMRTF